ncbi:MAG: valine--tRNA ligase [Acidobacteriota bacterium]
MPLDQYFEASKYEQAIYERWESSGAFRADVDSDRPAFTISMPPPNATGTLHLGHAVGMALEDVMIRWRRMAGDEVLWLPGTDHAAIATESVVIRNLQKEGMADPRHELGRDGLVAKIAEFVEQSRGTIRSQIRALGASCDWSRERYTMDATLNRAVNATFARMFRDGLIYRGLRIINWDPHLKTTVADDEIETKERPAKLYTMRYGPFLVATSRPETKLGDTAVAVHPDDERWQEHIGKTYEITWPQGPTIHVRVVADQAVDPETGTGALGVTPAHSAIDFEIAERHGLPLVQVIDEDGRMTAAAGERYQGMTVEECRAAFVADLDAAGLLAGAEDYIQPTPICYRSKQVIEPLPKAQWFVDVNKPVVPWKGQTLSIRQVLRDVIADGDIQLLPKHEEKTYFHWIDNLRDWCISRQIWWGHRIPVWYRGEEDLYVGHRSPEGAGWEQDPDTLDTWFSSALWTWSTLIDPELAEAHPELSLRELLARSPDVARFHPTSVMETGYDILFFWIARMILMTTYMVGEVPFHTVYMHGLILDRDGDKMSKSKPETAIDPQATIADHGADVLRMSLVLGNAPGKDLKLSEERLVGVKRLINKLWNAGKLVERTVGEHPTALPATIEHPINQWMMARLDGLVDLIDRRFGDWAFGDGAELIRTAFWSEFCDVYLEAIKVPPLAGSAETAAVTHHAYLTYLKLFHPFMPYVTEVLWREMGGEDMLIGAPWPAIDPAHRYPEAGEAVDAVVRAIGAIRSVRAEQGLEPKVKIEVAIHPTAHRDVFEACAPVVERLVRAGSLELLDSAAGTDEPGTAVAVDAAFEVAVRLGQADREAEKQRLEKQLEQDRKRLGGLEKRLADENFLTRAKPIAVEKAKSDAEALRATIQAAEERLATLG